MCKRSTILLRIISRNARDTIKIGKRLGKALRKGMVVSLEGSLGVGKTTLVKGLAKALGIDEEITSPSFTIMSVYKAPITLYHIDLYRIDFPEQLADIGIDEVLYEDENGVAVIEWGAKAESLLPEGYIRVHFQLIENGTREITITGLRM